MKKKINIDFDAPVTVTFAALSVFLFLLDSFIFKGKMTVAFMASPATGGELAFEVGNFSSYMRLFFYAFGAASWEILITNLLFILLLGPSMEAKYGSVIIGIMMAVSTLFSGVLTACFCKSSIQGCTAIVFMMIFLNSFMSFSKKKIPLSFVLIFILFIVRELFVKNPNGIVGIIIGIAGGLCGSLFAFLTSPKARSEKKAASGGLLNKAEKAAYLEELDSQSPRNKKKNNNDDDDDDTTVVGTLKF